MTMNRILILAAGLLALALSPAGAQEKLSPPHISISGEATMTAPPDMARLRAGVSTTGPTARDASAANRKAMATVMAAIKTAGIAEKDIQTSRYSIHPVYGPGSGMSSSQQKITGYMASNAVTLTTRKLDDIGDLIDKLTDAGANTLGGVEFVVSDANKLLDKIRGEALGDARRKAQLYADAAGVKLGNLLSLSENINMPRPMMYMARAASPAPETSISSGENTLQVSVNATFELMKP
jgi:uncharacterized protein YggE